MARILIISLLAIIFIFSGCASEQKSIINDPKILSELDKVTLLSIQDVENDIPLTRGDLSLLSSSVSTDPIASHYMEELYWMVDHNETEHLGHTIDFLETYLKTGSKAHCTPHELWHASLYARHGDLELLEHATEDATESFPLWVSENEQRREKFPQFYHRLDAQVAQVDRLIGQLNQKNYSIELIDEIDVLSETALC